MKKITLTGLSIILLGIGTIQTSCFGQFKLTQKVWEFNDDIGGDNIPGRFLKTIVFWVMNIIPVYGIAATIDVIILNVIEFWSGSNPMAMNEGDIEIQNLTRNGIDYKITATKNKFHVKQLSGKEAGRESSLFYNPDNLSWNVEVADQSIMVAQYVKDEINKEVSVVLFKANGESIKVPFSEEGLAFIHSYKPNFDELAAK